MISRLWKSRSDLSRHQDIIPYAMVWKDSALLTALSQITENRKVWTRKPLIFRHTIFGFCLEKAILRQSPLYLTAAGQELKSCVFLPLADTILDPRLQNAYKMPLRGDALRIRGATQTPGARTAGRRASVRRTQRCAAMVDAFLNKMYRSNADFVFTVTRDFVRACQTPLLVLPDDVPAHPYAVAMEVVRLAPKAAVSIYP